MKSGPPLVEQHRDAIGSEVALEILCRATADRGLTIAARGKPLRQRVGKAAQIRRLPAHDESCLQAVWRGRDAVVGFAGGARLRVAAQDQDTVLVDEIGNARLDLRWGKNLHAACVVRSGIEHAASGNDGDADAIDFRVQQIGAMAGGVHPLGVNLRGVRTNGHVLFNQVKVRAGLAGSCGKVRLPTVPMSDRPFGGHAHAVLAGGGGERLIPLELSGAILRAGVIGQRQQLFRRGRHQLIGSRLRVGRRLGAGQASNRDDRQRQTQNSYPHTLSSFNKRAASCRVILGLRMPFSNGRPLRALLVYLRHQPLAAVGVLLLATFVVTGIAAPWIAPYNPSAIDLVHRLESPSAAHPAGTDELGRDTFSRLLWGARLSLAVSVTVVAISLALGLVVGGLAGYLGGWIDSALTTFAMNTFMALPGILLAIAFAAFLGPGFTNLILALAIGGWAGYARLVRAQVMAVRDREYVDAARALGASGLRIFFRHILPNIIQPILVQGAIGMAGVILAEATLSFLGLGIPAPAPSWGAMLNDARLHLFDSPHLVLFPAVAVAGAVLGFNFLGDALRDQLDPRTRLEIGL